MRTFSGLFQPSSPVPSTVILDANVLYQYHKRNVILYFLDKDLIRAHWTERILEEWKRSVLTNIPDISQSILRQETKMREGFPEALVTGFEPLETDLVLPGDPDDRNVLTVAIQCQAQYIVTDNLKHFPVERLAPYRIEAIGANAFLGLTYDLYPKEAYQVLREIKQEYKNPSYNHSEFVDFLVKYDMGELAN